MSQIADYMVLSDSPFRLSANEEKTFRFTLPTDFVEDATGKQQPLLAYIVNPGNDDPTAYEIDVNDIVMKSKTLKSTQQFGLWEAFNATLLESGTNTIQFRYESGTGVLTISDVVLWFQRAVS